MPFYGNFQIFRLIIRIYIELTATLIGSKESKIYKK